jgi:probable HAF family extracellular repeat protein
VKFQNGTATQLETQFGFIGGIATAINDQGDYIVSNAIVKGGTLSGFVGFQPANRSGALNDSGDVAGSADTHAAIWRSGVVTDAGILPGYDASAGTALSDDGRLVGTATVAGDANPVGFIFENGGMTKISPVAGDDIVIPYGVNTAGKVVGTSSQGFVAVRGFLYQNGVTQDLNNLISRITGWQILHAYGINNRGQIIGLGVNGGVQHAVLLNPKS